MLDTVQDDTEGCIDNAANRVVAHAGGEEERRISVMAVEPVPVVVVRITRRGMGDRVRRRMDRKVVERAQH